MLKKLIPLLLSIILIAIFCSLSLAQQVSLAYINSERLRTEYNDFIDAQNKFDSEVSVWEDRSAELEDELLELQREYEKQALLLSEDKKKEKQRLIEEKKEEYQNYLASIFGKGGEAEQRNTELTAPLLDKINVVLQQIAEEYGYTIILDAATGAIAYATDELDITDIVLEELNKED
ncbi:OmpH family outer membrane protein [bacterium]|nr:OmpH family outer membrane protein [bacterium]